VVVTSLVGSFAARYSDALKAWVNRPGKDRGPAPETLPE